MLDDTCKMMCLVWSKVVERTVWTFIIVKFYCIYYSLICFFYTLKTLM